MRVSMDAEVVVPANGRVDNAFNAQQFQTIPFNALLRLMDTGSATGLRRSLNVSGTQVLDRGLVSSQNRVPVDPDDNVVTGVEAMQGQQVFAPVENTTAGALTYRARLWIEEAVAA